MAGVNYPTEYSKWRGWPGLSEAERAELARIADDAHEIDDRFGRELSFGTGGMRGVLGVGTNRMNRHTVRRATMGYASYLLELVPTAVERGVAIAYDPRIGSAEFAQEAAHVLASRGIPVHTFDGVRPTPLLSYAVRSLEAAGGIVITASHNPPEYNGYKVYGEDGVQLLPDEASQIASRASAITEYLESPDALKAPVETIRASMDEQYLRDLEALIRTIADKLTPPGSRSGIGVVYTPLHGTGYQLVPAILSALGFTDTTVVREQCIPDGEFPTVAYPNPEDPRAYALAQRRAEELSAQGRRPEILLATDPDCDRVGVSVWDGVSYRQLTGNQVGVLLADMLVESAQARGLDLCRNIVVKTIVSTEMVRAMCAPKGIRVVDTLTGFKYIGAFMGQLDNPAEEFLLGFEESCGYLTGDLARDKDAVLASALVACAAARLAARGLSLLDRLHQLYDEYGYFFEDLVSVGVSASTGAGSAMASLREAIPESVAGFDVKEVRDYLEGYSTEKVTGAKRRIDLPREDCIQLILSDGGKVTLRPSGTEPKLKLYIAAQASSHPEASKRVGAITEEMRRLLGVVG